MAQKRQQRVCNRQKGFVSLMRKMVPVLPYAAMHPSGAGSSHTDFEAGGTSESDLLTTGWTAWTAWAWGLGGLILVMFRVAYLAKLSATNSSGARNDESVPRRMPRKLPRTPSRPSFRPILQHWELVCAASVSLWCATGWRRLGQPAAALQCCNLCGGSLHHSSADRPTQQSPKKNDKVSSPCICRARITPSFTLPRYLSYWQEIPGRLGILLSPIWLWSLYCVFRSRGQLWPRIRCSLSGIPAPHSSRPWLGPGPPRRGSWKLVDRKPHWHIHSLWVPRSLRTITSP